MEKDNINQLKNISDMYEDWFLDYASYVILERAIPKIDDGLKPVQRRILHSMKDIDDGRYNKVANIIGHTMQYHPHGDQAIGDALVLLGQKDLLIDTQGNWGDFRTGDRAAAPRYIEARLSKFSLDVCFNNNITEFQDSYDGRKKEPIALPVKFPILLVHGVEGIAVGLSTKILPHNFVEIIKSSIAIIKDKPFKIFPDFQTGGLIDVSDYKKGKKGGKIRVRSHVEALDKHTLVITSLPYNITSSNLIESIIKANNSGKIKIKSIEDNTAQKVEIIIHLIKGVSPDVTIDALYAFTNCEVSISPNCCIISNDKPEFTSVDSLLKESTNNTVLLLRMELEFDLQVFKKKLHSLLLEQIFIENKIYRKIENCETWEQVLNAISKGLEPYVEHLEFDVRDEDILRLTEIKIKKISKYDSQKQKGNIEKIKLDIQEVENNIMHINDYAVRYFERLLQTYGDGKERKTEIVVFDSISARRVVLVNKKLFINRKDGFIGLSLKNDEFVSNCSSMDNIIVFLKDGRYMVTKIENKKYVGKDIIHAAVWKKNDEHMVYNVVYEDSITGYSFVKRFAVTGLIKDKFYDLTRGNENSKILYFTYNANSESEEINIFLHGNTKAKRKAFDFDFKDLAIKSRSSKGNILTKYKVRKIVQKSMGTSTLGGRKIYLDKNIGRLNSQEVGDYLGSFESNDKILVVYKDGKYEMTNFELTNRYRMSEIKDIQKFNKESVYSILYYHGKLKKYYLKRFYIDTQVLNKKFDIISDSRGSKLLLFSNFKNYKIQYNYRTKRGEKKTNSLFAKNVVDVKGWKAVGNQVDTKLRMSGFSFNEINDEDSVNLDSREDESENLQLF